MKNILCILLPLSYDKAGDRGKLTVNLHYHKNPIDTIGRNVPCTVVELFTDHQGIFMLLYTA